MRFLLLQTVSPTIVQNTHYIYRLCIRAVGQFSGADPGGTQGARAPPPLP